MTEDIPAEIKPHIDRLDEIEKEFYDAETDVLRYTHQREQPLYDKRDAEIANIPKFWLIAFSNHTNINQIIEPEDEEALGYLTTFKVTYPDEKEPRSFNLTFEFTENPFFTNKTLSRTFNSIKSEDGDEDMESEPISIDWKEGKSLVANKSANGTNGTSKDDKENGKSNENVDSDDSEMGFSFFQFFLEPSSSVYVASIGHILADEIYPRAVSYYKDEEIDEFEADEDDLEDLEEVEEEDEEAPVSKKVKTK